MSSSNGLALDMNSSPKQTRNSRSNRQSGNAQSSRSASRDTSKNNAKYVPKSSSKPGTPSAADSSTSWRKADKPEKLEKQLSAEAKPFLPPLKGLSPDAPSFTPSSSEDSVEVKIPSPEEPSKKSSSPAEESAAPKVPSLNTSSPRAKGSPSANSPRYISPAGRTPRTPGEEKYDYYNPYDVHAPKEFRAGIDAIYGLPFGGSLAFVFDGVRPHTVCKSMGAGLAELKVAVNEKLEVDVTSGGMNDGDVAKICINGKDYCPNQRGVNILVVDTKTLDAYVGVFDTHTHIGNESSHLTRFLTAIPESHVVLIAIRYDAARRMHPEARDALKARGVDIPQVDNAEALAGVVEAVDPNCGADLLSMAATVNAVKCAEVLIRAGWDVDHQKRHGSRNTPLLDAVFHGSVDVVRVLLDAQANVNLTNKWQENAVDIATKLFGFHSLEEMVGLVMRKNQSVDAAVQQEAMQSE